MQEEQFECSFATRAIDLLHGRRRIEILCVLRNGPSRLGRFARLLPWVSKKVITQNLRQLEGAGLVERRDLSGAVRHVEYHLTEGMRLPVHQLLTALERFGAAHDSLPRDQGVGKV